MDGRHTSKATMVKWWTLEGDLDTIWAYDLPLPSTSPPLLFSIV